VINFHAAARERKLRDDNQAWVKLGDDLRQKLRAVQLDELRAFGDVRDWDSALALARRLAQAYPGQREQMLAEVARQLARHVEHALEGKDFSAAVQRVQLLDEYIPNNQEIEKLRAKIQAQAMAMIKEANKLKLEGKNQDADVILRTITQDVMRL